MQSFIVKMCMITFFKRNKISPDEKKITSISKNQVQAY